MTHVKADQGQVSAICVQVVETLLLEVAAQALTLRPTHGGLVQDRLQVPQGSQNVVAQGLEPEQTEQGLVCFQGQTLKPLCHNYRTLEKYNYG